MNKNQTAREIIIGLDEIATYSDPHLFGLPCGNKVWYAKMESFVLSKLDQMNHLSDEGKMGEPAEPKKYPIGGYAPGNYWCTCITCGNEFKGDKRAVQCEPCANLSTLITEYEKLKEENAGLRDENGTVSDMNKWAMGRVEELEYALKKIEQMSDPGDYYKAICDMKSIATNVLNAVPIPTLSDDELRTKAVEILDRVVGRFMPPPPKVIAAMIEMYKLKL